MAEPLFRKKALEQLSRKDGLDQALRVTNPVGWLVILTLIAFIIASVIWSIFTEVPVKVNGQGILLNPGGVVEIVSSSEGRLMDLLVTSGERIQQGQIVANLDQSDLKLEHSLKEAELEGLKAHLASVSAFHKRDDVARQAHNIEQSRALDKRITLLNQRLRWQKDLDDVLEGLWKKKLVNREKLLQNRIEISQIRETLAQAETERTSLSLQERETQIEYEREVLDISEQIATIGRELDGIKQRLTRHGVVRSPYSGLMVESKVNAGEFVSVGLSLLSLMRDDEASGAAQLSAVVYVPPSDGKKIKPGMTVDVAVSTIKREEHGFIRGRVRRVAEIPSTSQGMLRTLKNDRLVESMSGDDGAPFEVQVELLTDEDSPSGYRWSSGKGPDTQVHSGTLCDADVSVRYVRLIALVFPALERWLESSTTTVSQANG